ncbi:hypothetical protein [Arcticibacter tournemirensis]
MTTANETKKKIGAILSSILDLSGVSRINSANALDITKTTQSSLLDGTGNYGIDLCINAAKMLGMRFDELTSLKYKSFPKNFREILLSYHTFINSEALPSLSAPPTYRFAINTLIQNKELEEFTEAGKIIDKLMKLYSYSSRPASISNDLKDLDRTGEIESVKSPKKRHHYLYRRARNNNSSTSVEIPFIPSYIKITQKLKNKVDFDLLYKMSNLLLFLYTDRASGKALLRNLQVDITQVNVKTYIYPLVEAGLIASDKDIAISAKEQQYYITETGIDVLNLDN